MDAPAHYECDGCGACCKTWRVLVSAADAQREPRIASESRKLAEHEADDLWQYQLFPLPFHEGCCFLGGDNRCGIYETRPRVCRGFEAGSERCQEARREQGLGVLLPGMELVELKIAKPQAASGAAGW